MSNDGLDAHARRALASERRRNGPSSRVKDRVRQRLDASIGGTGPGSPDPAPGSAGLRALAHKPWVLGGLLLAAGVTALAYLSSSGSPGSAEVVEGAVAIPRQSAPEPPKQEADDIRASASPPRSPEPAPSVHAGGPARHIEVGDTLAAEHRLLSQARAFLLEGRLDRARASIEEHQRRFARGLLLEERDAIVVQLLAREDRREEARAQARIFHERYPGSLFGSSVSSASR